MRLAEGYACLPGKTCPISDGECPGHCVFADVMRSANLGILVFDSEHEKLFFANEEARRLLGQGGIPVEYGPAHDVFFKKYAPDRAPRPGSESCRIGSRLVGFTAYSDGPMQWVFCRDISEKARLESIAEAVELTNSLGHVFNAVRHELGNPVNSSKMALSVLRRNFDRYDREQILSYVDGVLGELERVSDLLGSLRSFSLYEEVQPEPLEIDHFLRDFVHFVRRDYAEHGIRVELDPGAPSALASADPRALRQVLLNVLANAADAVGKQEDARIVVRSHAHNGTVFVQVSDNGPGISDDVRDHLFESFATTKPHGTGLGLVIARKMLARMAATIELENSPTAGTSVLLTFQRSAT